MKLVKLDKYKEFQGRHMKANDNDMNDKCDMCKWMNTVYNAI